jgi:hypothetical protein
MEESNLAEASKEGRGSKRTVLLMMMRDGFYGQLM